MRGRKGINWDVQPLGMKSDADIASALGLTRGAARRARLKRGIAAFPGRVKDWDVHSLGTRTDAEIAGSLHVTRAAVREARRRRGIPASAEQPNLPPRVEHKGELRKLSEWARQAGLNPHTLYCRLLRGWSWDRAIGTPAQKRRGADTLRCSKGSWARERK